MSIESKVRELLNGNAAVNYRIHFPDGERPDICNANIEQESISMSEKVCSQDTLKFGLCEASSFQCTVADIEEKHITANKAEGSTISINDSIAAPVIEFSLYGKSTQGENPTPDAPQEITDTVSPVVTSYSGSQLEDGKYEYESTATLTGSLRGIPVTTGENYTDGSGQRWVSDEIIKYGDGTGKRIQRIGVLTLDGSETITAALGENKTEKTRYFKVSHDGAAKYPDGGNMIVFPGLCSHFERKAFYDVYWQTATEVGNSISMSGAGSIAITHTGCSTVSEFKTWLAANHVTVLYELATPAETDLTAEEVAEIEKISTFDGTTTISNNVNCYMKAQYRCNAYSGEMIKNPKPLRGNIKGCRIQVFLEVDISCLTADDIAEYGQTADDVDYVFYRIPMGEYTVDSCKKQTNMDMRQIIAYDALKSDVLDKSCLGWLKRILNVTDRGLEQKYYPEQSKTVQDIRYSLLADNGMATTLKRLDDGNFVRATNQIGSSANGKFLCYTEEKTNKIPDSTGTSSGGYVKVDFIRRNYSDQIWAGSMWSNQISYSGKILIALDFDMSEVTRYNDYVNTFRGTSMTAEERLDEIKGMMCSDIPSDYYVEERVNENGSIYTKLVQKNIYAFPGTVVDTRVDSDITTADGKINVYGSLLAVHEHNNAYASYSAVTEKFDIVKSAAIYEVPDKTDSLPFLITIDADNGKPNVDENRLTVRNMLSAMLEIEAKFGVMQMGALVPRSLGSEYCTLADQRILSATRRLNVSADCTVDASEQKSIWYDEDSDVESYGKVVIKGSESDKELMNVGFGPGGQYVIEGNLLLDGGLYSKDQRYNICRRIYEKLRCIRIVPVQASTAGLPFRHAGDFVTFEDDGTYINTYVLTKDTDGALSMTDSIDSTNISK